MDDNTNNSMGLLNNLYDNRVRRNLSLVLLLLAVFLVVKSIGDIKEYRFIGGGVPVSNTITVSGEGEVFAVPDVATFSFSVVETAKDAPKARDMATEKVNSALALLEGEGIEERDIKTTNYSLYPKYEYKREAECSRFSCPPGKQVIIGYELNQTVEVKIRNTDTAGDVLALLGEVKVQNISGLNFTIDDDEALKREARKEAIDNAREKAKQLAKDLDVKLVRVVSFSESGGGYPAPYRSFDATLAVMESAGGIESPQIPTGENKINSNVTITYEIR